VSIACSAFACGLFYLAGTMYAETGSNLSTGAAVAFGVILMIIGEGARD